MPNDTRCTYLNEGGVCGQAPHDSVHTGWTDAQSGMQFLPLHAFTTEVITTAGYHALVAEVEHLRAALRREFYGHATVAETAAVLGDECP